MSDLASRDALQIEYRASLPAAVSEELLRW